MRQFKYDLAIAYRIYPKISANKPSVFADDKLKLAELCLKSLKDSLGGLRVKLWVFLNGCPAAYDELFLKMWPQEDLILKHYAGVGPAVTLHAAACALMDQTDAEFVCFSDDDYFYLPGQFEVVIDFFKKNPDADFVSLYDHPDLHALDLHKIPNEVRNFGGKEWVSCFGATHTFLATRSALVELRGFLLQLFWSFRERGNPPDLGMWMALTKKRVFNLYKFIFWLHRHRFWSGSIFLAWFYCWRQIMFGRRYTLWVPRPSMATHMVAHQEAPGIDWRNKFAKKIERENT